MSPNLKFNVRSAALATGCLPLIHLVHTTKVTPLTADPKHKIYLLITNLRRPGGASNRIKTLRRSSASEGAVSLLEIKGTPTFSAITSGRLRTVAIFKGSKSRFGKVAFNCKIEREILLTEKPAYGG